MVVDGDAIVYPRAVTVHVSYVDRLIVRKRQGILIVLRNASATSLAMFAPQRSPNHARDTKVALIKLSLL